MEKKQVYEQVGVAMTCRSYQEYADMFQLTDELLQQGPVLDVAAGASSFTAEARQNGVRAMAVDPLYGMDRDAIYERGLREIEESTQKLAKIADAFSWEYYGSPGRHQKKRIDSLERFIRSFADDVQKQTYVTGALPSLPFEDDQFALVLGSHFLFLYHEQFDDAFHLRAVMELMRVCRRGGQVRLYPLIGLDRMPYPMLPELLRAIEERGGKPSVEPTPFRFLDGATHYLQITK